MGRKFSPIALSGITCVCDIFRNGNTARFASAQEAGIWWIGVADVDGAAHVVDHDVARTRQQRSDLLAIMAVVGAVVVLAHGLFSAPGSNEYKLTGLLGDEHAKTGALRLSAACICQFTHKLEQLRRERGSSVHLAY
jgi:hypothetical protein